MDINMGQLKNLISRRADEVAQIVEGTGYLPRTVLGVATFLLDNDGDYDLLTDKQKATFDKFIKPLLEKPRR
jgi:hypothetical protein